MTNPANGKTVFVAGGAKGIGLGIVKALAADGYDVSFSYRGSADEAAQAARNFRPHILIKLSPVTRLICLTGTRWMSLPKLLVNRITLRPGLQRGRVLRHPRRTGRPG